MAAFAIILPFLLLYTVLAVWVERKIAGFIQDRLGPMEVGFKGILQSVADLLKLLQKEDIVPTNADRYAFKAAPVVIFASVFAGFATMPLAPNIIGSQINLGLYFLMAIVSLDVIGFMLAGWASNNKFSLLGGIRAVAQMVSYEVPLGIIILSVVVLTGTFDLHEMSVQQGIVQQPQYLFGAEWLSIRVDTLGGILQWNIIKYPLLLIAMVLYYITSLAEANRGPFDIPEADSEIIAGFQTEYSGFRWSMIMLGEYGMMLLVSVLGVVLFFGGWNTPFPNIGSIKLANWTSGTSGSISAVAWGLFWLLSKTVLWVASQMWVRWTLPRLRVDQLMYLSWKVLTPASLIVFMLAITIKLFMLI